MYREPPGCAQFVTRSWDERETCKTALPHTGLPRGPEVVPGTRSREEKGTCKAALPLEAVPGAGMSLSSFYLTVVGLSINFWKYNI